MCFIHYEESVPDDGLHLGNIEPEAFIGRISEIHGLYLWVLK
jgi:hypothetical protein